MPAMRSFGGVVSDPGTDPRVRRVLDRFARSYLWVDQAGGIVINDEGKLELELDGSTLTVGADGLKLNPSASPTLAGLTLTGFSGYLKATSGVVAASRLVPESLASSATQTGNGAGAETTLFTYTVPANTLSTDLDAIEVYASGTTANTTSTNKRIRLKFGATTIFDNVDVNASTPAKWSLRAVIVRTGAATQKCEATVSCSDGLFSSAVVAATAVDVNLVSASETLSGSITLQLTGSGTNANDVVGELWRVQKSYAV